MSFDSALADAFLWGALQHGWLAYIVYTAVLTQLTIAAVTIFLHRCQAHRSLDLHPAASHFFRLWLWLTTGMVTKEWTAVHRKHHAKSETEDDPHSPQVHGLASVLFGGVIHYVRAKNDPDMLAKYGYGTPDDWLERRVYAAHPKLGVTLMALVNVALFGLIPGMIIWTIQMAWIPFWAAGVINGVGHFWGYRNFHPHDESRNIVPLGLIIGGEELHNNHHAFPTSARFSNRWYELDIGWFYIRLMEKAGLAKVKRVAPVLLSTDDRAACDLDTLQSVIANRLEVVSRFARSVQKVCHQELRRFPPADGITALKPKTINDWLRGMERRLTHVDREAIRALISESAMVAKVDDMKTRLASIWNDRNVTRENLVDRLRQWCADAEQSGIAALAEFARELRGYRSAPAAA